jgi:hypothetical protein
MLFAAREVDLQRAELGDRVCLGCRLEPMPANTVHIDPRLGRNHDLATLADCISMCRQCHGAIDGARAHYY